MPLDELDQLAQEAFDGYVVRKDLVRQFKGRYPVPTYVVEFLLGRYCASFDEAEIADGLEIVRRQLEERAVRAGEEELAKSRAKDKGTTKLIDVVKARLDAKNDSYVAELPSLQLRDVRIDDRLVGEHERMLTGGFYAEVTLRYDPVVGQERGGRPFEVEALREIQLSKGNSLETLAEGRRRFETEQWKVFLLRSVGFDPSSMNKRAQNLMLLRMVPFVERNYNAVELGPRGTGKSHLFQQVSPYAHLVSGGKATVARMFVNMASGQRGLVCQYDVVCFDEVSGVSFDQKDGVNIMKGYMESGEFSRGKESIRADGGVVMVGNFDVDVAHQQRVGHLFGPMPPEMRDDTALMDRIHAFMPGWDAPKLNPSEHFTNQFGLVSDFLSECWHALRVQSRAGVLQSRVQFGGALSGRDANAVNKTASGLLKLLYPDPEMPVADDDLEWAVRIAMEARRRVKEQQKRIGSAEYRNTQFSYVMGLDGTEVFVSTPELQADNHIGADPLPPGQVWGIGANSQDEGVGLYRVEVNVGPGSGHRILNQPVPRPFRESMEIAAQNLNARSKELVGDRNPRQHEFTAQLRAFDAAKSGTGLSMAALLAMSGALLGTSLKGGLVVAGVLNLGGSLDTLHNAVDVVELAVGKGASSILMPVSSRRQLNDLSDEMAAKAQVVFYADARDALLKSLAE
jgi:ATP-dependent Lon protease